MATVKDELGKLFDRLNDFTELGNSYDLTGDIARIPKLQLAKQIADTFVSKDNRKEQDLKDWLRNYVASAGLKVTAKEAAKIKDWDKFVFFKRQYSNLLKTIIRELGAFGNKQKWLDIKKVINSLNKINLEETWGRGKVASAGRIEASEKSDAEQRQKARAALKDLRDHIVQYQKDIQQAADIEYQLSSRSELKSAPFFWNKGDLVIPFGAVDKEYEDLWVILTDKSGSPGLGRSQSFPGIQFIKLTNLLKGPYNPDHADTRIRQYIFIHEFTHYLDSKRKPPSKTTQKFDSGDIKGYFNDPSEYNAYYQEALEAVENVLTNDRFAKLFENQTADEFIRYVKRHIANYGFVENLEPKYERKLKKRLARFYTEVLQPRMKELASATVLAALKSVACN